MLYSSLEDEVDTKALIAESLRLKKTVLFPWVNKKDRTIVPLEIKDTASLVKGSFGIMEPAYQAEFVFPLKMIDLVFVPGIAFDKWGNRLGRGLGFYDRFLSELDPKTVKAGLAFDIQLVEGVPTEEGKDVVLDLVISNFGKE